jgi:hypothetical protein
MRHCPHLGPTAEGSEVLNSKVSKIFSADASVKRNPIDE